MVRSEITAHQFVRRISNEPYNAVRLSDFSVKESIKLKEYSGSWRDCNIYNCELNELEIGQMVTAMNLVFAGGTRIEKLTIKAPHDMIKLEFSADTYVGELTFLNYAPPTFNLNFKSRVFTIKNEAGFKINELQISQFVDAPLLDELSIQAIITNLKIERNIGKLTSENSTIVSLTMSTAISICRFIGTTCETWNSVGMNCDLMELQGRNRFITAICLRQCKIDKMKVDTSTWIRALEIGHSKSTKRCSVDKLEFISFDKSPQTVEGLYFHRVEFKELVLTGYDTIRNLELKDVVVENALDLTEVTFDDKYQSLFDVVDLRRCVLKVYGTKFNNTDFRYVEWPTRQRFYEFDDVKLSKQNVADYVFKLKNIREVYRRLRITFHEKSDMFDAMVFQANELRIQEQIKYIETFRIGPKSFWINCSDWFLLWSNSKFSNFGLSWTRPLWCWLFGFHLVLVYALLINFDLGLIPFFDVTTFKIAWPEWKATVAGLNIYLKLLFPVHDNEIVHPYIKTKVDIWGVLDFSIRIVSSYFIFLIIRGTRKFNFKIGA